MQTHTGNHSSPNHSPFNLRISACRGPDVVSTLVSTAQQFSFLQQGPTDIQTLTDETDHDIHASAIAGMDNN